MKSAKRCFFLLCGIALTFLLGGCMKKDIEVEDISLSATETSAGIGQTIFLQAAVTPEDATNPTLTWTSSNSSVAAVSEDGTVSTGNAGTAAIICESENGVRAVCRVTVTEPDYSQQLSENENWVFLALNYATAFYRAIDDDLWIKRVEVREIENLESKKKVGGKTVTFRGTVETNKSVLDDLWILVLEDWTVGGTTWPQGMLITADQLQVYDIPSFMIDDTVNYELLNKAINQRYDTINASSEETRPEDYLEPGTYLCLGKNNTCKNITDSPTDLYCDACDPDGDNYEGVKGEENTLPATVDSGLYTPGTYSASAQGISSDVAVTMTFDAESITDVQVNASGETAGIGGAAAPEMAQRILSEQSGNVDAVAGATVTSDAIKKAAVDCIAQAKN